MLAVVVGIRNRQKQHIDQILTTISKTIVSTDKIRIIFAQNSPSPFINAEKRLCNLIENTGNLKIL
jgi:hypothetical protein